MSTEIHSDDNHEAYLRSLGLGNYWPEELEPEAASTMDKFINIGRLATARAQNGIEQPERDLRIAEAELSMDIATLLSRKIRPSYFASEDRARKISGQIDKTWQTHESQRLRFITRKRKAADKALKKEEVFERALEMAIHYDADREYLEWLMEDAAYEEEQARLMREKSEERIIARRVAEVVAPLMDNLPPAQEEPVKSNERQLRPESLPARIADILEQSQGAQMGLDELRTLTLPHMTNTSAAKQRIKKALEDPRLEQRLGQKELALHQNSLRIRCRASNTQVVMCLPEGEEPAWEEYKYWDGPAAETERLPQGIRSKWLVRTFKEFKGRPLGTLEFGKVLYAEDCEDPEFLLSARVSMISESSGVRKGLLSEGLRIKRARTNNHSREITSVCMDIGDDIDILRLEATRPSDDELREFAKLLRAELVVGPHGGRSFADSGIGVNPFDFYVEPDPEPQPAAPAFSPSPRSSAHAVDWRKEADSRKKAEQELMDLRRRQRIEAGEIVRGPDYSGWQKDMHGRVGELLNKISLNRIEAGLPTRYKEGEQIYFPITAPEPFLPLVEAGLIGPEQLEDNEVELRTVLISSVYKLPGSPLKDPNRRDEAMRRIDAITKAYMLIRTDWTSS